MLGFNLAARAQVTVVNLQPARQAVSVDRAASVSVGFSQPIAPATAAAMQVYGSLRQGKRAGSVGGGGTATLTFRPSQPFAPGELLSVSLPPTLTSPGGTPVARQVYQFTGATGGPGRGFFLDTARVGNTTTRDQVLGDLDNDGDLDLVTTGALFGCRVFLNDGTGRYRFKTGFQTAEEPAGLVLSDVNQDGYLDVLTCDTKNATVAVRINDGTADFALPVPGYQNAPVGARPVGVAAGDLDGDGDLDLATANAGAGTVSVWVNSGSLAATGFYFTTVRTLSIGAGATAIALADVDNDGDLDVVTTHATSTGSRGEVHVSRNVGNGTFSTYTSVAVGAQPTALALADVDGDGDLDLLTADADGASVSLRLNNGSGTLGGTTTLALPVGSTPSGLSVGDVDGDGDLDLLVAQGAGGRVFTFLNTAGTFTRQGRALRLSRDPVVPSTSLGVTLGDVDGDLDLDLITSDNEGRVLLSRNGGAPPPLPVPIVQTLTPAAGPVGMLVTLTGTALTDVTGVFFNAVAAPGFVLNGAGTGLTVAVPAGASSGAVTVVTEDAGTATAPGSFTVTVPVPVLLTSTSPLRHAAAAARGGRVSATFTVPVTAATAGNLRVFGNQRRGRRPGTLGGGDTRTLSFDPAQDFAPGELVSLSLPSSLRAADGNQVSPQVVRFTAAVGGTGRHDFFPAGTLPLNGLTDGQLGDVDNDGDLDLVACAGAAGGVLVQLNAGNATFTAGPRLTGAADLLVLGDVDADGDLDIISSTTAGSGTVWLNDGRGSFAKAGSLAAGSGQRRLVLADVDADGDLDLLTAADNRVGVWRNDGTGAFGAPQQVSPGLYPLDFTLGDVDNDGDLDLLAAGYLPGPGQYEVATALNDGTGTFTPALSLPLFNELVQQLALGDVDGDGDLDLALTGYSGQLTVRLNDGRGRFGTPVATLRLAGPALVLADADADGDLDVITHAGVGLNDGTGRFPRLVASANAGASATLLAVGDLDGDLDLDLLANDQPGLVQVRLNRPGPPPSLSGLTPGSGPVSSPVRLTGTYLNTVTNLTFNGVPATTYTIISPTELVATVPTGATSGPVVVTTPAGTAPAPLPFTVTQPLGLVSLSPPRNTARAAAAAPLRLTFTQPVTAATAGELRVFGGGHGRLSGTVTGGGTSTLTFTPSQPLAAGEAVSVSLPDRLTAADGSRARRQGSQFTVAAAGTGTGLLLTGLNGQPFAAYNSRDGFAVGDVDQDGDLDVVTTDGQVRFNDGEGAFPDSTAGSLTSTYDARRVVLADLDGDADLDLLASNGEAHLNDGRGEFTDLPPLTGLGADTRELAVGDLDSDGDLDVVAPNYARDSVYVLFNDGTGRFPSRLAVAVGNRPASIRLGDVDNDGDLDFITANEGGGGASSTLSIGFNNGIGWFGEVRSLAAGTGLGRVVLGDLDGDQDLDLVTDNGLVRFNNGAGSFGGSQTTVAGPGLALADLDADGDLDLVVAGPGGSAVRRNDGTGQFGGTESVSFGAGSRGHDPVLADLDGDGDLDMLTANATGATVFVSLNQRLAPPALLSFSPASGLPGEVVVLSGRDFVGTTRVEFNGTAAPGFRLATASRLEVRVPAGASTGPLQVVNPQGTATSTTAFTVLRPVPVTSRRPAPNSIVPRTTPVSVTFAQAVPVNSAATLAVFSPLRGGRLAGSRTGAGSSTLSFAPAQPYQAGELLSVSLPAYTEANQTRTERQTYQFRAAVGGTGRGTFSAVLNLSPGLGYTNSKPVFGDVNGDGYPDLLTISQYRVESQLNDGRAGFGAVNVLVTYPYNGVSNQPLIALKLGDVDGDGDLDLAVSEVGATANLRPSVVHMLLNDGRGAFTAAADVPVDAGPVELGLVDVDADGDLDVFTESSLTGTCSVALNDGRGQFSPTRNQPIGGIYSPFHDYDPLLGDLDGDGDLDLIGAGEVFFNDGLGRFTRSSEPLQLNASFNTALALADVDGDGDLDLLNLRVSDGLGVRFNDGRGRFPDAWEVGSYLGDGFDVLDVGDLDADGDLDVLLMSRFSREPAIVLLNEGRGRYERADGRPLAQPYTVGSYPVLCDLDGDQDLDLLYRVPSGVGGLVVRLNGPAAPLATAPAALAALIKIYPNPAHGWLRVVVPPALRPAAARPSGGSLRLYNAVGQLVLESPCQVPASGELTVDLTRFPPGLYTLRLPLGETGTTHKLVID